jgi:hypothetical protein
MLPETVRKLLEQRINSIEKLEIVSTLGPPGSTLTLLQLEGALPIARGELQQAVAELTSDGIVVTSAGSYQIAAGYAAEVEDLMTRYHEDRVVVLSTLTAIAMDRIRGMAARTFADAFVLRKKGDRDG